MADLMEFWLHEGCKVEDAKNISLLMSAKHSKLLYNFQKLHSLLARIRLQFPGVELTGLFLANIDLLDLNEYQVIQRLSKENQNHAAEASSLGSGVRLESLERVRTRAGEVNLQGRVATVVDCDIQEGSLRLASFSNRGQHGGDGSTQEVWYAVRVASSRYVSGQNLDVQQLSVRIPAEATQVVEILVEVESHDQGWASNANDGESVSFTWGELRAVDSGGQTVGAAHRVYTNKPAEWEWQCHLKKIVPENPFINNLRAGMYVGLW
eukprot:CAMPEP_0196574000 /NCGR_PEP_ID=MMETSP1081-20130531/3796_1 /TAXON_ID=36882 /ORGANISM="Pyramimonas amylifera, Strain CCMP720" /LENGTH=265 /DNA_ID=CAMNT_0041891883 /DNA_START=717 /DNA_END=1511 /DNA_ORIENTATION=+